MPCSAQGSVFIAPDPGALAGYLDGLAELRAPGARADPARATGRRSTSRGAKLDEYVAHRLERERRLLAALDGGRALGRRDARCGLG